MMSKQKDDARDEKTIETSESDQVIGGVTRWLEERMKGRQREVRPECENDEVRE